MITISGSRKRQLSECQLSSDIRHSDDGYLSHQSKNSSRHSVQSSDSEGNSRREVPQKVSRNLRLFDNESNCSTTSSSSSSSYDSQKKNTTTQHLQNMQAATSPTQLFAKKHQPWPEPPTQPDIKITINTVSLENSTDPKTGFWQEQVQNFNDKYAIEAKTCKSTSGYIWKGMRRSDGLAVVAKQIPKHKVHRFGRIEGFPNKLPYEFVALHRIRKYAKSEEHTKTIVKLLDFYERRSSYVMVMEQLENSMDLLDYLNMRQQPLDERLSRKIFKQACRAALACKRAGVYHRDWKDENIVIDRQTHEIRLIDFGCAIPRSQGPFKEVSGTPQFSPPEWWDVYHQNRDKREARRNGLLKRPKLEKLLNATWDGDKAEMWGLGIMLYTMLHIKLPFQTEHEIRNMDVCSVINPGVSNECYHLISSLLTKQASRRMTLDELLQHPWLTSK